MVGITGSGYSVVLRLELYGTGSRVISTGNQYFYNLVYTVHGLVMIFYLVMPVLYGGIGNYMVPVYQGTSEVGFPRTNGSSLLVLVPVSLAYILVSVCMEYPGGTGWTLYPPLALTLPTPTGTMVTILALVSKYIEYHAYGISPSTGWSVLLITH